MIVSACGNGLETRGMTVSQGTTTVRGSRGNSNGFHLGSGLRVGGCEGSRGANRRQVCLDVFLCAKRSIHMEANS